MTNTATNPEMIDARAGTSWCVIFRPDDTLDCFPAPKPDDDHAAFLERVHSATQCGFVHGGQLSMPRPGGGRLSLYLCKDHVPSRAQLAQLRPFTLSRWSARLVAWGEIRWEEGSKLFDIPDREPAIMRMGPAIGPGLAASCTGKPIKYSVRDDGLRCGGSPGDPDVFDLAGWIEEAVADEHGLVASIALIHPAAHHDLASLDADGDLESARLCLQHSARATARTTAWGLRVFDVTQATATRLSLTSLAHSRGTHVLRRLDHDEPLGAVDFRPTDERLHVPRVIAAAESATPAEALAITPGAVTPIKRSPLLTLQQTLIVPTGGPNGINFTHNLGVIPHVTVDAEDDNIFTSVNSVTTTTARVSAYNFGPTVEKTITAYCW